MSEYLERIERAVRSGDQITIRQIIRELIVIGACDHVRANDILTHMVLDVSSERLAA